MLEPGKPEDVKATKAGSKQRLMAEALAKGATIEELMETRGWNNDTVSPALRTDMGALGLGVECKARKYYLPMPKGTERHGRNHHRALQDRDHPNARPQATKKSGGQLEWETAKWVHWTNTQRVHSTTGYITETKRRTPSMKPCTRPKIPPDISAKHPPANPARSTGVRQRAFGVRLRPMAA